MNDYQVEHRLTQLETTLREERNDNKEFRLEVRNALKRIEDSHTKLDTQYKIDKAKAGAVSAVTGFLSSLPVSLAALIKAFS